MKKRNVLHRKKRDVAANVRDVRRRGGEKENIFARAKNKIGANEKIIKKCVDKSADV